MRAEERAKAVVALLRSDFGQSGEDVWFLAIRDELNAHANEALEGAAKVAELFVAGPPLAEVAWIPSDKPHPIAAAIRALKE